MDDIVRQLASQLGISAGQAEAGAGTVLKWIQQNAPAGDFQALLSKVPGAASWIGKATDVQQSGGTGGLLGQAAGLLGSLGGDAGGVVGALATLGKAGLDPETISRFVPMLLEQLQSKAGQDLVNRLAGSVPFLKDLAGEDGGRGGLAGGLGKLFG